VCARAQAERESIYKRGARARITSRTKEKREHTTTTTGASMPRPLLTRFEAARVVGLRALQLDAGAEPRVHIADERLRCDAAYVATRELEAGVLDARVRRPTGEMVRVEEALLPAELVALLNVKDGGNRRPNPPSSWSSSSSSSRSSQSVRVEASSMSAPPPW
jgi:DNA-directed RNA polymerase subunit K/omega